MSKSKESIQQIVDRATIELNKVPENEWMSIYDNLNDWTWDDRLGEKPDDWDTMRHVKYRKILWHTSFYFVNHKARTLCNIICPIQDYVESCVGKKAILRYHHIHNLGRTNQEFEDWWESKSLTRF